jgi:hypothetical protein
VNWDVTYNYTSPKEYLYSKQEREKMNLKTTYGLLLLTVSALFIAPQVARSGLMMQVLPFVLYLIPGIWVTVLIKNISKPS